MDTGEVSRQDSNRYSRLSFNVDEQLVAQFLLLLQQGVKVLRRVGCSVDEFLRTEIGAGQDTIEHIQSIMLDGKPVDDLHTALVHEGSVLALSAALPGLVGATLRRGGAYSSFRSGITYRESGKKGEAARGWIGLKLFNLLMGEMGPGILRQGVLVDAADIIELLAGRAQALAAGCSITLDGRPVSLEQLRDGAAGEGKTKIILTVSSERTDHR